jgi:hypothetical protein
MPKDTEEQEDEQSENPFIMSEAAISILDKGLWELSKRDQDNFDMHFYTDFSGYGYQEVIENRFMEFNSIMNKRGGPNAIDLWIQLSSFAQLVANDVPGWWGLHDDGPLWMSTVGLIGIATLTTLDALERAGLLRKDSPVKDIQLILALLGDFFYPLGYNITEEVPCVIEDDEEEACWPYIMVQYAKRNGIDIGGIPGIKEDFLNQV